MAFGFRPATPGTIVVLAATVLLVLVSVSVPITKSIWFLKANVQVSVDGIDINGVVTLGCWGYCIGDNCTSSKLGYNLDILKLVGGSGSIAGVSTAVLKWITYLLILHPIAAALAAVSTILGLLAHLRGFGATCFTTCVASLAATVALLAFVFDIVVFLIAKKRIEAAASGESAQLGNAVWMTLAAMALLLSSGFFFGCGACLIRRQRHEKQVSDLYRPQVDENYGSKMRNDAYANTNNNARTSGNLPAFAEYEHEREYEKDPEDQFGGGGYANQYNNNSAAGAGGYSSRPNQQLRFASNDAQDYAYQNASSGGGGGGGGYAGDMVGAGAIGGAAAVGTGAGARLAAEARAQRGLATQEDLRLLNQEPGADRTLQHQSSVEPFTGMYDPTAQSRSEHEQQDSYSASPYYNPSQMGGGGASVSQQQDQPTSPSRLVGPRPLSTGPALQQQQQQQSGPRSPTYSAGQHSQSYHQYGGQQQSPTYGSGAYPPYPAPEHYQSTSPPPQQQYYQQGGNGATDMYGAPTRSYDRY